MGAEKDIDLGAMDEQEARQLLTRLFTVMNPAEEYALRHEGYAMEMPSPVSASAVGTR